MDLRISSGPSWVCVGRVEIFVDFVDFERVGSGQLQAVYTLDSRRIGLGRDFDFCLSYITCRVQLVEGLIWSRRRKRI